MQKLKPSKIEIEKIKQLDLTAEPAVMLNAIGGCTDWAYQNKSKFVWGKTLKFATQKKLLDVLSSMQRAELHYFVSNIWADAFHVLDFSTPRNTTARRTVLESTKDECLENQILHLRKALAEDDFEQLSIGRKCQIYTNLGNHFSEAGRVIKAFDYWHNALRQYKNFSMAVGNLGLGYLRYGNIQYHSGYAAIIAKHAYNQIIEALSHPDHLEPGAAEILKDSKDYIEKRIKGDFLSQPLPDMSAPELMGRGKERDYRQWCLEKSLFLSPLNDIGPYEAAARDILYMQSVVTSIDTGPIYHGFYNQMKQEFIAARYLYYESLLGDKKHFADKNVDLADTLDYPSYSIKVEKTKMAFRSAYSLLDKIAYFLNNYLEIGYEEHQVSFKGIWRKMRSDGSPSGDYDEKFTETNNYPLKGLLWLSKDIYETRLNVFLHPDAKTLDTVRNHIEHKYFKLHDYEVPEGKVPVQNAMVDHLAYSMFRGDFLEKTEQMLKMAREALIYLTLAMVIIEKEKAKNVPKGKITPPMFLPGYDEQWKR